MKGKTFIGIICFLLLPFWAAAQTCDCEYEKMTPAAAVPFGLIVNGTITGIEPCNNGLSYATVKVNHLYKGECDSLVLFAFDCISSCQMAFAQGDEWILYLRGDAGQGYEARLCDRNRRKTTEGDDFYVSVLGTTYDQELEFLKKDVGYHKVGMISSGAEATDITTRENRQTDLWNKALMLLASTVGFLLLYFWVNRYLGKK